jgi:DNA-binding NtrC family response regulator
MSVLSSSLPAIRQELVLVTADPTSTQQALENQGFRVLAVGDCLSALQVIKGHPFDALLVAQDCTQQHEFLERVRESDPALQVLLWSDSKDPSDIAQYMRVDLIARSIPLSALRLAISRSAELTRLRRENSRMRRQLAGNSFPVAANHIGPVADEGPHSSGPAIGSDIDLASINRAHVTAVLAQHGGNKARTARALGINRRSLYRLLDKYGK